MKKVRLGKTNLWVSRIGIGGIPLQRPSEEEAIRVVRHALDLGINLIDTARGYGSSEIRIGKAIAGRRDQVILATKTPAPDKANSQMYLEQSLERLGTDYLDLWQFHGVNSMAEYEQVLGPEGAMEAALDAKSEGKVLHIGISSHVMEVALTAVTSGLFETIQFPFNFVENAAAERLIPLAREHDVGFIAMKPFGGGRLSDARLAFKYLLQFDSVVPDPGVEKVEEIEEIVDIVEHGPWELTAADWAKMEDIRNELGTRFCRQCEYCMPCPQGVQIPMLMIMHVMWKLWPKDIFGRWMGQMAESARNCIGCGECESRCPYQLPIREMMAEHIAFYEKAMV